MELKEFNHNRNTLNKSMMNNDGFFKEFGALDNTVYTEGAIPKKYKELTGLAISVLTRCEECTLYHLQNCIEVGANKEEIIEAIKIGVIGGGSITYPTARIAFRTMKDLNVIA